MRKILIAILILIGVPLVLSGCVSGEASSNGWPDELIITQYPNENNPNTPSLHEGFADYLEEELGIKVTEYTSIGSYAPGIEAMASGQVHMMIVSPQSFNQAKIKAGAELFATTSSDADYYSTYITQADNDEINTIEDLRGTNFAFVDPVSSSGYLYPKATLVSELDLDSDMLEQSGYFFENVTYAGGHDKAAIGVSMGDYDAAAVGGPMVMAMLEGAGILDPTTIKVVGRTPDIPNTSYVMAGNLPEDLKEAIKEAFYTFDNADYFEAIHGDEDIRFVEIDDSYYSESVEILRKIGVLEED